MNFYDFHYILKLIGKYPYLSIHQSVQGLGVTPCSAKGSQPQQLVIKHSSQSTTKAPHYIDIKVAALISSMTIWEKAIAPIKKIRRYEE